MLVFVLLKLHYMIKIKKDVLPAPQVKYITKIPAHVLIVNPVMHQLFIFSLLILQILLMLTLLLIQLLIKQSIPLPTKQISEDLVHLMLQLM